MARKGEQSRIGKGFTGYAPDSARRPPSIPLNPDNIQYLRRVAPEPMLQQQVPRPTPRRAPTTGPPLGATFTPPAWSSGVPSFVPNSYAPPPRFSWASSSGSSFPKKFSAPAPPAPPAPPALTFPTPPMTLRTAPTLRKTAMKSAPTGPFKTGPINNLSQGPTRNSPWSQSGDAPNSEPKCTACYSSDHERIACPHWYTSSLSHANSNTHLYVAQARLNGVSAVERVRKAY